MAVRVDAECHRVVFLLIVEILVRRLIVCFNVFVCVPRRLFPTVHVELRREHVCPPASLSVLSLEAGSLSQPGCLHFLC